MKKHNGHAKILISSRYVHLLFSQVPLRSVLICSSMRIMDNGRESIQRNVTAIPDHLYLQNILLPFPVHFTISKFYKACFLVVNVIGCCQVLYIFTICSTSNPSNQLKVHKFVPRATNTSSWFLVAGSDFGHLAMV